jgi:hypothetical protein
MATLTSSPSTVTILPAGTVPAYIANLAPGAALQVAAKVSSAFADFAGEAGDPIGIFGYSGGAYDTRRGRYMHAGGGHNDHNGNGVYGFNPYASESPTWTLFKPHTVPPSVTSFLTPSVETAPNGDPASTHTYNQIVYDAHNDRLVMMGLGSAAGSSGVAFRRIRALTLATNTWDSYDAHPSTTVAAPGSFACYDATAKVIWCKVGQMQAPLQRFDVVANTLNAVADGVARYNIDTAGALDPTRRYMIAIGGYSNIGPLDNGSVDMVLWDLSTYDGTRVTSYARNLSGFPSTLRNEKLGIEFHPPSGSFVAWNGGNTLFRLIPPSNPFTGAWSFQTLTPTGTGLPTMGSDSYRGVYSKFRWAPSPTDASRGVFIMDCVQGSSGAYTASNVAIYKPNF